MTPYTLSVFRAIPLDLPGEPTHWHLAPDYSDARVETSLEGGAGAYEIRVHIVGDLGAMVSPESSHFTPTEGWTAFPETHIAGAHRLAACWRPAPSE